jgi:peroxiredoxin
MLPTETLVTNAIDFGKQNLNYNQVSTLSGKTISLTAFDKTTIVYFFAPWCQICHASIGNLQARYQQDQELNVIAVALDFTDPDEVLAFTKQHQLTFPIALGNEAIKQSFEITGYPSYYVINEENMIVSKSLGYSSELGLYLRSL